jgi:hypothetical protein
MGISAQQLMQTDPEFIQRQLQAQEMQRVNPTGGAAGAIGAVLGRGLGNVTQGRGFFEPSNPGLKRVTDIQNIMKSVQFDPNNPASYYQQVGNALLESGYADLAPLAFSEAQKEEANQANIAFKTAQAQKMMTPTPQKPIQIDLGDRIQLRDPVTNEVIEEIRKGVTPAQRERMAEQQAQEQPGFIGKTGAYRNKFGEVIPATEMSKQRQGFVQAQDLLAKLNRIDYDTVKKAQSPFDYTEPGITKTIGSQVASSTVNAQTTIAATQLLEQIEKLPPGSASDADMRAAIRDFPGYGNAENLANWVNRTKETLGESLARQNELYGFPVQVKATPRIGPKKKEQKPASTWRIVED